MSDRIDLPSETDIKPDDVKIRSVHIGMICEHGRYFTVCGLHPKIFMRGLDEDDYQQIINFRDRLARKNGFNKRISWREFAHLLALEIRELYPHEKRTE